MTPEVLERFKKGKCPERHEMSGMDLFLMLAAMEDGSSMEFLDKAYQAATALYKTDPEFAKEANQMTVKLHTEHLQGDDLADMQDEVRGNMCP